MMNVQQAMDRVNAAHAGLVNYYQEIINGAAPDAEHYDVILDNIDAAQRDVPVDMLAQFFFNNQVRTLGHRPTTTEIEKGFQQFLALQERLFSTTRLPRKMIPVHQKMLQRAATFELGF